MTNVFRRLASSRGSNHVARRSGRLPCPRWPSCLLAHGFPLQYAMAQLGSAVHANRRSTASHRQSLSAARAVKKCWSLRTRLPSACRTLFEFLRTVISGNTFSIVSTVLTMPSAFALERVLCVTTGRGGDPRSAFVSLAKSSNPFAPRSRGQSCRSDLLRFATAFRSGSNSHFPSFKKSARAKRAGPHAQHPDLQLIAVGLRRDRTRTRRPCAACRRGRKDVADHRRSGGR